MLGGTKFLDGKHAGMAVHELAQFGVWVVFRRARGMASLRNPAIIVVSKPTRRVLYDGPLEERS